MKYKALLLIIFSVAIFNSCKKECGIPPPECQNGFEYNEKGDCHCPKGKIEVAGYCREPLQNEFGNPNLNLPCLSSLYLAIKPSFDTLLQTGSQSAGTSDFAVYLNVGDPLTPGQFWWMDFFWGKDSLLLYSYEIGCPLGPYKDAALINFRLKLVHPDTLRGVARYGNELFGKPILDIPVEFYRQR